jgi:hypothetical protein
MTPRIGVREALKLILGALSTEKTRPSGGFCLISPSRRFSRMRLLGTGGRVKNAV